MNETKAAAIAVTDADRVRASQYIAVLRKAAVTAGADGTSEAFAVADILNAAAERLTEHVKATGRMTQACVHLAKVIESRHQAPVTQVAPNAVVIRPDHLQTWLNQVNQAYSEASQD